ncbi:hypothetical protein PRZ48_008500 [Zasmidium cellare]|uniref:DUF427 domain-containing protein n=1 Tax=Zasmidium cellare TaxID=395010 RepID=A0ABR0EFM1_ZASCE|nr:hypothetical protein PRZ48_008500 [Zasmidium cellare]
MAGSLAPLALKLATQGPVRTLPIFPRLIRLLFNHTYILQTTKAVYIWEHPYYPQIYIPASEFTKHAHKALKISHGDEIKTDDGKPVAQYWNLSVGDRTIDKAIAFSDTLSGKAKDLAGLVKVDFESVDQWFEEDTPIFVHAKDPFKRIEILSSTRHIVVRVGGQKVAETGFAMHLYETGLPTRFYMPLTSIDASVLRPSSTTTKCPYKGTAKYYNVDLGNGKVFEDVVWYYDAPLLESATIVGLCCFYNEKVEIELDGEKLESPVTHFSGKKPGEKPSI